MVISSSSDVNRVISKREFIVDDPVHYLTNNKHASNANIDGNGNHHHHHDSIRQLNHKHENKNDVKTTLLTNPLQQASTSLDGTIVAQIGRILCTSEYSLLALMSNIELLVCQRTYRLHSKLRCADWNTSRVYCHITNTLQSFLRALKDECLLNTRSVHLFCLFSSFSIALQLLNDSNVVLFCVNHSHHSNLSLCLSVSVYFLFIYSYPNLTLFYLLLLLVLYWDNCVSFRSIGIRVISMLIKSELMLYVMTTTMMIA